MAKLLKFVLGLFIIVYRCGLVFNVALELYLYYNNKSQIFSNIQWYICAIILDMYLMNLEKHLSVDIYIKKEDGQKTDTGDQKD